MHEKGEPPLHYTKHKHNAWEGRALFHVSAINRHPHGDVNAKKHDINLLKSNVNYNGRTAPLTSKVAFYIFIQQILYTLHFFLFKIQFVS